MKHTPRKLMLFVSGILLCSTWLLTVPVNAQTLRAPFLSYQFPEDAKAVRLGNWLHTQKLDDSAFLLGTIWATPEEKINQQRKYDELIKSIHQLHQSGDMLEDEKNGLSQVLNILQPTGRVLIDAVDSRWLEANPRRDPQLLPHDYIEIPVRTAVVRLMGSMGDVCELTHTPYVHAVRYVQACFGESAGPWAWIIHADGRVQKIGINHWNQFEHVLPSPGAWIWAPHQDTKLPETFQQQWVAWLATQGVSDRLLLTNFPRLQQANTFSVKENAHEISLFANRPKQYSSSNWGYVGLVQTPTARMQKPGNFGVSMNTAYPQTHMNIFFQPLAWAEMGIRYSDISNRKYGSASFSGDQSYKDKSMDLKLQVTNESNIWPAVAVGLRDAAGTGLFSSEYVVANKRIGSVDYSLGMAWGNMGGRGDIRNPLGRVLASSFDIRQNKVAGQGGIFSTPSWFHGPVALFGGLSYQSAWNTEFKVELDGNNYLREPQGNHFPGSSPINMMATYHWARGVDLNLGFIRGNSVTVGISLFTDISRIYMPKTSDPPINVPRPLISNSPDWQTTITDLESHTQWDVQQISVDERSGKITVDFENAKTIYPQKRIDNAVAVLNRDASPQIETFDFQFKATGDVLASQTIQRKNWAMSQSEPARSEQGFFQPPLNYEIGPSSQSSLIVQADDRQFTVDPGFDFSYVLQGPDAFVTYQVAGAVRTRARLPYGLQFASNVRWRLFGNDDDYKNAGSSQLPRVRTYMREYFVTSHLTLPLLTLNKTSRLSQSFFASTYIGYLEEMFGGAGAEVLYRKPGSPWAVGLDLNHVYQREFSQYFQFRNYQVNTGHLTGYVQTPFDQVMASVSVGQYLAGDKGATLTLTKLFNNGASMGVFATKTNVSAATFGEGSFDKGVFINLPFDAFMSRSSLLRASFNWRPLTRDGGAKLRRPLSLLNETSWLDPMVFSHNSLSRPPNELSAPDDYVYE